MEPVTEQELLEKSKGERVTLQDIENAIISEHYFTAAQGHKKAGEESTFQSGSLNSEACRPIPDALEYLTICVLRLWNGFTVLGQSACADPRNYDPDIGRRIARENAIKQMWPLLGYELKSRMARDQRLLGGALVEPQEGMQTYIGTKVVNAIPMTRLAYNILRGWALPSNENGSDEGYLVEYTDRIESPPHVEGFKGYVSWSPKDVFERAYRQVDLI